MYYSYVCQENINKIKIFFSEKKMSKGWVPVAHACNLSYSEGRDHEDRSSKPVQATSSRDLITKMPNTQKG
jgi:hypothetical protein